MSEQPVTPRTQCLAFLFAEKVLRDHSSKQHSLIGLFDKITASQLPIAFAFTMYILLRDVSVVDSDGKPTILDVRIVGPSGKITPVDKVKVKVDASSRNSDVILNFQMAVFESQGTYTVEAYIKDNRIAFRELTIDIGVIPPPPENIAESQ